MMIQDAVMSEPTWKDRRFKTREVAAIVGVSVSDVDNLAAGEIIVPEHQLAKGRRRLWSWTNALEVALTRRVLVPHGLTVAHAARTARKLFRGRWRKIRKLTGDERIALVIFTAPFEPDPVRYPNTVTAYVDYKTDDELQDKIQTMWDTAGGRHTERPVYIMIDITAFVSRIAERAQSLLPMGGTTGGT
jgi:hypothetical protein